MAGFSQFNERNMEIKGLAGSTMVVMEKVKKIDPDNASKIVGHLLSLEHGEQEIVNLAHATDNMFISLIEKTREELNLLPILNRKDKQPMSKLSANSTPFIPSASHFPRVPPVNSVQIGNYAPVPYFCPPSNGVGIHHHPQLLPMEAQTESGIPNVPERAWIAAPIRGPVSPDMRYYQQHNVNYYPRQEAEEFRMPVKLLIQRLEMQLINILKSTSPEPIPVSSLPALYIANFGMRALMVMQARVGCSLHDLLAQMPSRIRVIESSPNGEQCVILSEDTLTYVKNISEREEREQAADTSCQIFLTFSSHSTFTSQDVYDYFITFGPVRGVKLQPIRMYGFVTFAYAVSPAVVLSMGNPHFIRGVQVLVKPYLGKQVLDRKSDDNITFSLWSLTEEDSHRLTEARLGIIPRRIVPVEEIGDSIGIKVEDPVPSTHTPGINIEDEALSSHVPYVHIDAGSSVPSHVPHVHNDAGPSAPSSLVPYVYVDAGPSAPRGLSIGSTDRGKCIVTDPEEEERYSRKGKAIITDVTDAADTVYSDPRLIDIGKITITDADEEEEASVNDISKITVTDADEEGRYDDLNLPDNPFAYDFASMMGLPEWDMDDGEL